jgi:hypothetical protein
MESMTAREASWETEVLLKGAKDARLVENRSTAGQKLIKFIEFNCLEQN